MQIVRTEVIRSTTPSGDEVIRVHFHGEGGECVMVDMAAIEAKDDAAAVERATTILVQTATRQSAINAYDASSNGNFDEVAMTSAANENGGVYIFEYRDGGTRRQAPPARLPSLEVARNEAIRCAVELLEDLQPGRDPLTGWLVRVRGENGNLLCAVDVQEAETARLAGR